MARGRGNRMQKHWEGFTGSISGTISADATQLFTTALAFTEAQTILRTLGDYIITPSQAPTAGDVAIVAVGLAVISSDAFAAGVTAVPDPVGEPQYPWLFWASHLMFFGGTSVDPAGPAAAVRGKVDVKSMRKVKPRESLVWVAEYFDIAGAPPLRVGVGSTRVLLAE